MAEGEEEGVGKFEATWAAFNLAPSSAVCSLKEELAHLSLDRISKVLQFTKLEIDLPNDIQGAQEPYTGNYVLAEALFEKFLKCDLTLLDTLTKGQQSV